MVLRTGEIWGHFWEIANFVSFFITPLQDAVCCHDGGCHLNELVEGFPKPPWILKSDLWMPSYEENRFALSCHPGNGAGAKKFDRAQLLNLSTFLCESSLPVRTSSRTKSLAD